MPVQIDIAAFALITGSLAYAGFCKVNVNPLIIAALLAVLIYMGCMYLSTVRTDLMELQHAETLDNLAAALDKLGGSRKSVLHQNEGDYTRNATGVSSCNIVTPESENKVRSIWENTEEIVDEGM